ncbi:hypothetical protein [Kordiimonas marina]|uniref:hypothetical protein n=1 Tax=Kordiimonas marina TaxID=2872312 RepID=UPI001FF648B1|nr:hypothetical protein [Kordiimonas marina]MCJ9427918.1 hypothetical protein [Kordiimonas marina]
MKKRFLAVLPGLMLISLPAMAHIDLITPKPLMSGHGLHDTALKAAPFGAPGVDAASAKPTVVKAGSTIDLRLKVYKVHPGEIVVSYTRDMEGEDVFPVYDIASLKTPIPHKNVLLQASAPCSPTVGCTSAASDAPEFHAQVKLPDIEGDIILVVRQVMRDKVHVAADGSADLSEAYYHQAAKLRLVR